jgi:hypothetical protein
MSPPLARSGHCAAEFQCLLLRGKRTSGGGRLSFICAPSALRDHDALSNSDTAPRICRISFNAAQLGNNHRAAIAHYGFGTPVRALPISRYLEMPRETVRRHMGRLVNQLLRNQTNALRLKRCLTASGRSGNERARSGLWASLLSQILPTSDASGRYISERFSR